MGALEARHHTIGHCHIVTVVQLTSLFGQWLTGYKKRMVLTTLIHSISFTYYKQLCNRDNCRGGPAPDRLSAALISRKFVVARACVRGPRQQADVSAAC